VSLTKASDTDALWSESVRHTTSRSFRPFVARPSLTKETELFIGCRLTVAGSSETAMPLEITLPRSFGTLPACQSVQRHDTRVESLENPRGREVGEGTDRV
jgi:hypothetical protein